MKLLPVEGGPDPSTIFPTMKLVASEKAFEIKVAFIGLKNSGKSTLINALLKDKYAPVGIGGATTSVNSFRIFTKENPPDEAETQNDDAVSMLSFNSITSVEENSGSVWTVVPENLRTAAEIQNMISAAEIANMISEHRISHPTSHEIQELTFDVELPEGLCEMRADTNLTLIDIPGIGNIDSECKSLSYLVHKSHTFDCVVFVFDALQPIKKQASLLNFVKTILAAQIAEVPVIVVFNKVDDGNNPDIASIELEALWLSQQEFGKLLIPLSANLAFAYRAVSGLSFERFKCLNFALIDTIGYNEFARSKWMIMTQREKCEKAFEAVSDASKCEILLASTNFTSFHRELKELIGGDESQRALINRQLNVALYQIKVLSSSTVASIKRILHFSEQVGVETPSYKIHFWKPYKNYTKDSIAAYKSDMDFKSFNLAMSQLIEFDAVLTTYDANDIDHQTVMNEMIALVRAQISELLKHASAWSFGTTNTYTRSDLAMSNNLYYNNRSRKWNYIDVNFSPYGPYGTFENNTKENPPHDSAFHWYYEGSGSWRNKYTNITKETVNNPVSGKSVWYDLSLADFKIVFDSILLMSYHEAFCLNFGPEKIRMDSIVRRYESLQMCSCSGNSGCSSMVAAMAGAHNDVGTFVPDNKDLYDLFVRFKMPDQISNPHHWGHLTWMFCKFMDSKRP